MNHFVYVRKISAHTLLILWIFEEIPLSRHVLFNFKLGGGGGGGV